GMALRFTLWPHREVSTTRGRMFGRLRDGDEFVAVFKVYAEDSVCALTRSGRLLCCTAQEVSLLSGPGLGVILIKLEDGDEVAAAFPGGQTIEVEKATGGSLKIGASAAKATGRGGKGTELWKRGAVKRVILPEPTLPDLEAGEAGEAGKK